jgi:hypothetical protein
VNRLAHGAKIARAATSQGESCKRPGEVRRSLELLAQHLAQARFVGKISDGIEPSAQHADIGERAPEPACKLAGPCRSDRAVYGREQTSGARALIGAH